METDKQRDTRRAISSWLTEQENNFDVDKSRLFGTQVDGLGSAVRALIIQSLAIIDARLKELNNTMTSDKYNILAKHDMVRFYMKGGNAFKCIIEPEGLGATKLGGGDSDWDTQIIIDPWAPRPIIDTLYGLVEDIVLDEFSSLGKKIASEVVDYNENQGERNPLLDFSKSVLTSWETNRHNINDKNFHRYALKLDEPQSLRRVYDHDRIGLWMKDRKPLSSITNKDESKWLPGMMFNDAIKPFVLYRLAYSWHAYAIIPEVVAPKDSGSQDMYVGDINKPILMELIDVTIPRNDSIESVRVWEEIIQKDIKIHKLPISVDRKKLDKVKKVSASLPIPDVFYHASELAIMLCEIADGSSRHVDKMLKRFMRLKKICDINKDTKDRVKKKLSDMVGVIDICKVTLKNQIRVTKLIDAVTDGKQRIMLGLGVDGTNETYKFILNMMNCVEKSAEEEKLLFNHDGSLKDKTILACQKSRETMRNTLVYLIENKIISGNLDVAYSDDLVLLDYILENGYLDISKVGFSGINQSVVLRVPDYDSLMIFTAKIASTFTDQGFVCRTKMYNTPRTTRISYESLLVIFSNGKADKFITLTTAREQEAPFVTDPVEGKRLYAPISDIANQRRVSASLIEDYIIGAAISRQYEAIKEVVNLS